VAGTYALTLVLGRGPSHGTLILSAAGSAERRVRYQQSGGGLSPDFVARGTFHAHADGRIELRLQEDTAPAQTVWRPATRWNGDTVELRYPDPGDGEIVETYRRQ